MVQAMVKISQEEWVMGAARAFGRDGVDRLRVETLAKELGVSKGSFYWHFKDRDALLDAVVSSWEELGTYAIIRAVNEAGGTASERLWTLLKTAFAAPVSTDDFEIEVRAFAMRSEMAKEIVSRVDSARLKFVVELLVEHGLPKKIAKWRADLFYRTLVGDYLMHRYGMPSVNKPAMRHLHEFLVSKSA